jgi:hypothetical protein
MSAGLDVGLNCLSWALPLDHPHLMLHDFALRLRIRPVDRTRNVVSAD